MSLPHILVVDDHREIRDAVTRYLDRNGMRATPARDTAEMDARLAEARFDLIVLDLMMPGEDGLSACRRITAAGGPPVLMLTALGDETDRIVGLEIGADDYLPKPFNPRELLARIKAILRRSDRPEPVAGGLTGARVSFADWVLDTDQQTLTAVTGTAGAAVRAQMAHQRQGAARPPTAEAGPGAQRGFGADTEQPAGREPRGVLGQGPDAGQNAPAGGNMAPDLDGRPGAERGGHPGAESALGTNAGVDGGPGGDAAYLSRSAPEPGAGAQPGAGQGGPKAGSGPGLVAGLASGLASGLAPDRGSGTDPASGATPRSEPQSHAARPDPRLAGDDRGDGAVLRLTTAEFKLLTTLLERPRRVLSRETLIDAVSGRQAGAFDRSIDNLVSRLRRKIEADPANPTIITTVRAGGYCLTADVVRL